MENIIELNQKEVNVISGGVSLEDLAGEVGKIAGIGVTLFGCGWLLLRNTKGGIGEETISLATIAAGIFVVPPLAKEAGKISYGVMVNCGSYLKDKAKKLLSIVVA